MTSEQDLLHAAQAYESEAYRVTIRPTGDQLPVFASGYAVDLIATKGEERVIVQLKESREDLAKDPDMIRLAEAANQAGWRLDLMVLNPVDPFANLGNGAELPRDQIEAQLRRAEEMAGAGELPVACVLAWSALEATMRRTARSAGIKIRAAAPAVLTRSLYSQGLLSREELDRLDETLRYRNGAVHGLSVPGLTAAVPASVIAIARRLLAQELTTQGA
jgi:hypothetical protein